MRDGNAPEGTEPIPRPTVFKRVTVQLAILNLELGRGVRGGASRGDVGPEEEGKGPANIVVKERKKLTCPIASRRIIF